MYSLAGKPVAYEDLSVSAFVQGYLIVMHSEDKETKDKMAHIWKNSQVIVIWMAVRRYGHIMESG